MFNLDDYLDVATKIKMVHDKFEMPRFNIRSMEVDHKEGYVWAITEIYRDAADQYPGAVDVAYEFRDVRGVNKDFWVENCITSSYGRCASLILGLDKKPSKEDMQKVQRIAEIEKLKDQLKGNKTENSIPVQKEDDPWTIKTVEMPKTSSEAVDLVKEIIGGTTDKDIPRCVHGKMHWATGKSKQGKVWGHFKCMSAATGEMDRCPKGEDIIWYEISSAGNWVPQKGR